MSLRFRFRAGSSVIHEFSPPVEKLSQLSARTVVLRDGTSWHVAKGPGEVTYVQLSVQACFMDITG